MKAQLFLIYIIAISILCSCTHDNNETVDNNDAKYGLTLEEAKEFWENQIFTRSILSQEAIALNPGDYIPIWDKSIFSHSDSIANVDIPVLSENKYKILYIDRIHQKKQVQKTDVIQKLVITKNINNGKIGQYRIALIPTSNKKENVFISLGDKKQYSGWVIYFLSFMKSPFKIEKYESGKRILSIIIPREKGKNELSASTLKKILGNMQVATCHSINTRSSGEYDDFWDWLENEIFPNAQDGDSFTLEQDGDSWTLVDQDGNQHMIPDGLIDDDDIEIDDSSIDTGTELEKEPEPNNGGNDELLVWLQIYHKKCNTYLGAVDASSPGSDTFYCAKCRVYVPVSW